MLKKHAQIFEGMFTASDILVVSFAWVFSYTLRFQLGWIPIEKGIPPFGDYLKMLIFVWLIWGYTFRRVGLYRPMRGVSRFRELWKVVRANTLCVITLVAFTYLFREKSVPFSRLVFVIFWAVSTILMVSSRGAIRAFLRGMRRRGYNLRHVLIVGAGDIARRVADRMCSHPEYGIELIGCLANDPSPSSVGVGVSGGGRGTVARYGSGYAGGQVAHFSAGTALALHAVDHEEDEEEPLNIIGTYSDIPKILARGGVDQIIIALPLCEHEKTEDVLSMIGDEMIDVRIVPDVHRFIRMGSLVEEFDGLPVVSLASTPLSGINRVTKRIFDLVLGVVFFVVSLPVMLLTALLVKLTSPGPVFFSQERVGLDGKTFKILKFRTMVQNAEAGGAKFAVKGDARVTPLGRLLRRLNIDEVPQLINVLLGQMSLVGPRPERPVFINQFRKHIPDYMLRHKVQAGMTGWAQVNGWRGNTSIERRIEHDLHYIEHWSLLFDLKIIALTFFKAFRDRNAY